MPQSVRSDGAIARDPFEELFGRERRHKTLQVDIEAAVRSETGLHLNFTQICILGGMTEGLGLGQLGTVVAVSNTTAALQRLNELGLVTQSRHPADKRMETLHRTERGRAVAQACRRTVIRLLARERTAHGAA